MVITDSIIEQEVTILKDHFSANFKRSNILYRILFYQGIFFIKDLIEYSSNDLLKLPGMERSYVREIKIALSSLGVSLSMNNREDKKMTVPDFGIPLLDTPVKEAVFTENQTQNKILQHAFDMAGIKYIGDLLDHTEKSLRSCKLISVKRLQDIKQFFEENENVISNDTSYPLLRSFNK